MTAKAKPIIIAAPHTAMTKSLKINLQLIQKQLNSLVANGINGAFINGTTAEFSSLTQKERILIAEQWLKFKNNKLKKIIHVGGTCLNDCQELAVHAKKNKADGIAAIAPYFFKPSNLNSLANYLAAIAQKAPKIDFYFYYLPSITGLKISICELFNKLKIKVPNFKGIKYSCDDLKELKNLAGLTKQKYQIFFGCDEYLLDGLKNGATGAIGSTYNYLAPLYHQIISNYLAGNNSKAQKLQDISLKTVNIIKNIDKTDFLAKSKAIMSFINLNHGPVRPPLINPTEQQTKKLKATLAKIDFNNYYRK